MTGASGAPRPVTDPLARPKSNTCNDSAPSLPSTINELAPDQLTLVASVNRVSTLIGSVMAIGALAVVRVITPTYSAVRTPRCTISAHRVPSRDGTAASNTDSVGSPVTATVAGRPIRSTRVSPVSALTTQILPSASKTGADSASKQLMVHPPRSRRATRCPQHRYQPRRWTVNRRKIS